MNQRELRRLTTRRTLAEHALRLFAEQGFDATTVDEIAAAAGVSPRTFFMHFATKAAAAFPDHEERVANFVDRLGRGSLRPDAVSHLVQTIVSGLDESSPMRQTRYRLLATVSALREEDARTDRDYEQAIGNYLSECWGGSTEVRIRANAVANAVLGVVRASLVAWGEDGIDAKAVCSELLQRLLGSPFEAPLQSLRPTTA